MVIFKQISVQKYENLLQNNIYGARSSLPYGKLDPTKFPVDIPTLVTLDRVGYEIPDDERYIWVLSALRMRITQPLFRSSILLILSMLFGREFYKELFAMILFNSLFYLIFLINGSNFIANIPYVPFLKPFRDRLFEKSIENNPTF